MFLKTLLILLLLLLVLWTLLSSSRRGIEESEMPHPRGARKKYLRWKGPKTDERINRLLAESIVLLKDLGVPISDSVAPEVKLTSAHAYLGCCCPKGSLKDCTEYDYYIRISGFAINNTEKSLRNTLIHELIHTVQGGLCHTGEWKKWAEYVSEKTEYKIHRYAGVENGDETKEDMERWEFYGRAL